MTDTTETALVALLARLREMAAADALTSAEIEITRLIETVERLVERCSAYKGQVEAGTHEIARLRESLREIKETYCEARDYKAGRSLPIIQQIDTIVSAALAKVEGE